MTTTLIRHNPRQAISWEGAACAGMDTEMFMADLPDADRRAFNVARRRADVDAAKAVCARCAIRLRCYQWALERGEVGVWGMTTTEERKRERKRGESVKYRQRKKVRV